MKIKNVTIAGGGTLGSQVAWQTAFKGFHVVVYDAFPEGLEASKKFHEQFATIFQKSLGATREEVEAAKERLTYTTNLAEAVESADLISESVPENHKIKSEFYKKLSQVVSPETIITSNSSTLLPSDFVDSVVQPERFLALHFANMIWTFNVAEVMTHPGTDPKVKEETIAFAKSIGMVPIVLNKEQNGYVLNSILGPMLTAALDLVEQGVVDFQEVDRTWMISGNPRGPFMIMDMIGLETMYNVMIHWGETNKDKQKLANAEYLKTNYLDKGKLGIKTKGGFYNYPNPAFKDPEFLK
ncbi:3-hydroxybutyryl-CoA dehydrogenase [Reichenbachiella faecimaris]|uniref:3-hydroxybutyryl-CoA dehydrogenase n=1 Tax=Reichenbachiella faecimaris TaxID=692418 RepID=A0A1W2G7G8_REIFA|nr:3-hydroxyacyl-CoA dehydrogenase [Reichenbachiella faecimaris]SMD32573.1 3-hydroxybutyryl-CoA dehydrogenase [Reichenbachiella faecimaris]